MTNPRSKARIEARIKERVAYCLEFELSDPRTPFLTVTRVEVADDLSVAKVFYTVLGGEVERRRAGHVLEDAAGFVRRQLGRVLKTRRLPRIVWIYDESIEVAERVERAIHEALEKDRGINPEAHGGTDAPELELEVEPDPEEEAEELEREVAEYLDGRDEEER